MNFFEQNGYLTLCVKRKPQESKAHFALSHPAMLLCDEGLPWLNENLLGDRKKQAEKVASEWGLSSSFLLMQIDKGQADCVNLEYQDEEKWKQELAKLHAKTEIKNGHKKEKAKGKRVHILALGDVGSTVLTGLKLLGGDVISEIGIWDLDAKLVKRMEYEMNQTAYPFDYDRLPFVQILSEEELFHCDVFLFCAAKEVPPLSQTTGDVRMGQLYENGKILRRYAKMAATERFKGLFGIVSDPVDQLCRVAFLASNEDETGRFGGGGLRPEQIEGYGLGVMNSRAAYFAKKEERFSRFLQEGRAFGPHGRDLVIACSIENYEDDLSKELSQLAVTANLRTRETGFKPYLAPALSSAAISVILTLQGEWHYSANFLGGVYMGAKNKRSEAGLETESLPLPSRLYERLEQAYENLRGEDEEKQ